MRLIDANAILKADENSDKALVLGNGKSLEIAYALLKKKVEDAPTVDAVVVTRCKDCKYHYDCGVHFCNRLRMNCPDDSDFFCSYGERKNGGAE